MNVNEILNTKVCTITKLDETTYYLWDLSGSIPTPHYYKTEKAALKKYNAILKKVA